MLGTHHHLEVWTHLTVSLDGCIEAMRAQEWLPHWVSPRSLRSEKGAAQDKCIIPGTAGGKAGKLMGALTGSSTLNGWCSHSGHHPRPPFPYESLFFPTGTH